MVISIAQTAAFFESANQMAIPHATVVKLVEEGIFTASDLCEFDETAIKLIADNLKRPGGRLPDPNCNNPLKKATIETPPFVFGAKSQQRLNVACNLVRFYKTVGRPLTVTDLQWSITMSNFKDL